MDYSDCIITKSAAETETVGKEFGHDLIQPENWNPVCRLFYLFGDLGSGKTTFVRGFARGLGIKDRILSPTFVFIRQYSIHGKGKTLYHIDLYRAKSIQAQIGLGLAEIAADSGSIILIEWSEFLGIKIPGTHTDIKFSALVDGTHILKISKKL